MDSFIYTLSQILVLFILCTYQLNGSDEASHKCAAYNHECNPDHLQPCCDETLSCKSKKSRYGLVCAEKAELDSPCVTDEDCSEISHSQCSDDKKCICRLNNIRINDTYCAPSLGAFCWKDEKCGTDNAVCLGNECRCKRGHVKYNDTCSPAYLGMPCIDDSSCQRFINRSICSEDKQCLCNLDKYVTKYHKCLPKFNAECVTDESCATDNAMCIDNKCQCNPYHIFRGDKCVPIHLNDACQLHADCSEIRFATCSKSKKCACFDKYVQIDNSTCVPSFGAFCSKYIKCEPANLECIDSKCQFISNSSVLWGEKSIPVVLGSPCETDANCSDIQNSRCSPDKICICHDYFFSSDNSTCKRTLNTLCSNDDECFSDLFRCLNHRCKCKPNYSAVSQNQCHKTSSLYSCNTHVECSDLWHSRCSAKGKCVCRNNNIAINNSTCLPILDGPCWKNDQCVAENSFCSNHRCTCKPKFINVARNKCVAKLNY